MNKNDFHPSILREYDIRGIADRDLTDETVSLIGKAFATYLVKVAKVAQPTIVLGRDIRPSSDRIFKALAKALVSSGISVTNIGVVTTPICYFAINHFKKSSGEKYFFWE